MNGQEPAFPLPQGKFLYGRNRIPDEDIGTYGLTKREYIAIKAMQGLLSNSQIQINQIQTVIKQAFEVADFMIKEANNE